MQSLNFFEYKDRICQCDFSVVKDWEQMDINPPFILVENELQTDGSFYVINTHEYELPTKENTYTLGSSIVYIDILGFWRIKYK